MKKIIYLWVIVASYQMYSQIGIGTEDIESGIILKAESPDKGILIPRIALQGKDTQTPITGTPTTGLFIYNTSTAGTGSNSVTPAFYTWNATTNSWESTFKPIVHSVAKYINVGTNTDFNTGTNPLNIFDEQSFNEDELLYQKFSNGIKIYETGLFKFTLNLDMDGTSDRDIFAIDIYVDGQKTPETFFVSTVDNATGSNQDIGYVFTVYLNVPRVASGSYIYFLGRRVDGAASVYFKAQRTSSVTIERIR